MSKYHQKLLYFTCTITDLKKGHLRNQLLQNSTEPSAQHTVTPLAMKCDDSLVTNTARPASQWGSVDNVQIEPCT